MGNGYKDLKSTSHMKVTHDFLILWMIHHYYNLIIIITEHRSNDDSLMNCDHNRYESLLWPRKLTSIGERHERTPWTSCVWPGSVQQVWNIVNYDNDERHTTFIIFFTDPAYTQIGRWEDRDYANDNRLCSGRLTLILQFLVYGTKSFEWYLDTSQASYDLPKIRHSKCSPRLDDQQ